MNIYTIYCARNKINNKVYIGFDSNFPSRQKSHKNSFEKGGTKFYRALIKYGWESFEWCIIYQSKDKTHTLNVMEPHFIKENNSYKNGYNSTLGGEGTFGFYKSEKEKQSQSLLRSEMNIDCKWYNNGLENKFQNHHPGEGWFIGRINQKPTTKGNKWYNNGTEQVCSKTPVEGWNLGMLPKPSISEETKIKMSVSGKGRIPWNVGIGKSIMTPDGKFNSVTEAANFYGLAPSTISNKLKRNPKEYYLM